MREYNQVVLPKSGHTAKLIKELKYAESLQINEVISENMELTPAQKKKKKVNNDVGQDEDTDLQYNVSGKGVIKYLKIKLMVCVKSITLKEDIDGLGKAGEEVKMCEELFNELDADDGVFLQNEIEKILKQEKKSVNN